MERLETTGYTGLIVMAVLAIIHWGNVDIRIVFGVTSIITLLIYISLIGIAISESYTIIKKSKRGKKND
jgi:hypothetical protein